MIQKCQIACNYTGNNAWDFPIKGICFLDFESFDVFEERALKILNMKFYEYEKLLSKKPSYLMKFDKNSPTHNLLKKRMNNLIQETQE